MRLDFGVRIDEVRRISYLNGKNFPSVTNLLM